jgi:hypothetical protein
MAPVRQVGVNPHHFARQGHRICAILRNIRFLRLARCRSVE